MSINLYDQLTRLAEQVGQSIAALDDEQPLKRWFSLELDLLAAGLREATPMEDVSARMRAVRQLEYMVRGQLERAPQHYDEAESLYTRASRNPASHLEMVRQSNFSIEPQLLLDGARHVPLFDLVSPTAKVVGYLRSQDGLLAFADALTCPVEAQAILQRLGVGDAAVQLRLSLLFRARYQTINAVVAESHVHQVLEIASGISPRGLHWSREYPGTVYIESDLPALMRQKAKVMRDAILRDDVAERGVLHCCGLDALDLASLQHALTCTDPAAPLAIITEGLLLYFDAAEMQRFLAHMRTVLAERPRARWIVDFVAREHLQQLCATDPAVAGAVKGVFASTERAVIAENPFADEAAIGAALKAAGLHVVSQEMLADCGRPGGPLAKNAADARAICGNRKIWAIAG